MKQCSTKKDFMIALHEEFQKIGAVDDPEIFDDFEQHFSQGIADGMTEEQVCEKLGDVSEIAKQYVSEFGGDGEGEKAVPTQNNESQPKEISAQQLQQPPKGAIPVFDGNECENASASGFESNADNISQQAQPIVQNSANQSSDSFNAGGLIGMIILDVMVLSWALPSLAGIIFGYFGIVIGIITSGIATIVCGILGTVDLQLPDIISVITPFHPVSNILFGVTCTSLGALGVLLAVIIVKGFVNMCIKLVKWEIRVIKGENA